MSDGAQKPRTSGRGAVTRYEPHCDCLGGHVSMLPDPNGQWCRAEGWQDISTAPRDGTWFLAACKWLRGNEDPPHSDWLRIIRWDVRKGYERYPWAVMDPEGITFGGSICEEIPTHWRPLPEPPTITEADHA